MMQPGSRHRHYIPRGEKVGIKDARGTIIRLVRYLGNYRMALLGVFLMTTVTTIVGTRYNGIVVDTYIAHHRLSALALVCAIMAVSYLIASGFTYWQNRVMIKVAQDTSARFATTSSRGCSNCQCVILTCTVTGTS